MIERHLPPQQSATSYQESTHHDLSIIHYVDSIITKALELFISDIHIETLETKCRVRYRQHGILNTVNEMPLSIAARVITRLKVMAKLDIAESRLPQDGRLQVRDIDIRINTCPTLFGEKVVLRLLNSYFQKTEIEALNFSPAQREIFLKYITKAHGMILVTGPTGSGKTVTLYAALQHLNQPEKNISTVEDPVEIRLAGINQVNVNPKIGLSFSKILHTFLRQDPDVIMVGEIRDKETAEIALQSAQTGHLVLSTLHTTNTIESITRLQSMGIASYQIAYSITLLIAQRLVRKLCELCKTLDNMANELHSVQTIYRANGCEHCSNGYNNRIAIYEFLPFSEKIIQLILQKSDTHTLLKQAKTEGFSSLAESGWEKVITGNTSIAEINRVLSV